MSVLVGSASNRASDSSELVALSAVEAFKDGPQIVFRGGLITRRRAITEIECLPFQGYEGLQRLRQRVRDIGSARKGHSSQHSSAPLPIPVAGGLVDNVVFDVVDVVRRVMQLLEELRDSLGSPANSASLRRENGNAPGCCHLKGCSSTRLLQPFCNHAGRNFLPDLLRKISGPPSLLGALLDRGATDAVLAGDLGFGELPCPVLPLDRFPIGGGLLSH